MSKIVELQNWFWSQCDGDWEHDSGLAISTLDNPGWHIKLRLDDTKFSHINVEDRFEERDENDWISIRLAEGHLNVYGGPRNLEEAVGRFLEIVGEEDARV